MSFASALKTYLSADSGIVAVVGDRIHPLVRTASTLPAITYQVIDGAPENSLDGFTSGLWLNRLQIDVWAKGKDGYRDAQALATLVTARMSAAAPTGDGSGLRAALLNSQQDFYEDDTRIYRVMMDFNCRYRD